LKPLKEQGGTTLADSLDHFFLKTSFLGRIFKAMCWPCWVEQRFAQQTTWGKYKRSIKIIETTWYLMPITKNPFLYQSTSAIAQRQKTYHDCLSITSIRIKFWNHLKNREVQLWQILWIHFFKLHSKTFIKNAVTQK